ncbi:MAG: MFS transporter [Candidatus Heimdallarchaeota archaeon]
METSKKKDKVHSLGGHLLYSLGAVPSALPYNMISASVLLFYVTVVKLDPILFGIVWILYGIWNAVNDPLIGYLMDKIQLKKGRRIPYIIYGTIPLTFGFIFLWWVPYPSSAQTLIFIHCLIMLFLFDLGFTFCMISWSALYTEMYETEKERASVVAIKDLIAFIASFIGILIPPALAAAISWEFTGLLIGLFIPITMFLSILGSQEKKEYQIDKPLPFLSAIKEAFSNKPFVIITLTYTLIDFAFGLTIMVLPLFAKYVLLVPTGMEGLSAAGVAIGIILSVPLWRWIYSNKGPKFGLLFALIFYTVTIYPLFLIGDFMTLLLVTIIPGIGVSGMLMTEPAISTAIDYDEIRISKRREATYNGILTLIARLSLVISGITLIIVQEISGFDPNIEDPLLQPISAIAGLKILVSLVPVLGGFCATLIFAFFPINLDRFNEIQKKLQIFHEERRDKARKALN